MNGFLISIAFTNSVNTISPSSATMLDFSKFTDYSYHSGYLSSGIFSILKLSFFFNFIDLILASSNK